ncbi:DNA gyrase C-terminal beta-propeller domain-containing protein [Nannocystis pusilla]|uniref:DNA gyrase C-terminal beta-propeller domain-containing protein n=1 Tax=Nannocystis pusilla TaxID=889268 RepID=UPI003B7EBCA3
MVVTSRGKVIRTTAASISEIGRNTQGVRIIRIGEEERVVAVERILDREEEAGEEVAEAVAADETAGDEPAGDEGGEE